MDNCTRQARFSDPQRPPPARHAAPSAPWPWTDPSDDTDIPQDQLYTERPPVPPPCDHSSCQGSCWSGYPQSKFPNWTPAQVKRSGITEAVEAYDRLTPTTIYLVNVDPHGQFNIPHDHETSIGEKDYLSYWNKLVARPSRRGTIQMFFIQDITGPVLQMFGGKYNIEPFFWSSALSRIPSRYQEHPTPEGDHITITLTFIKSVELGDDDRASVTDSFTNARSDPADSILFDNAINTQAPLLLQTKKLVMDQLCVHLIRNIEGSTIISFQPDKQSTTTAKYLQERIRFAGRSVYWQNIFRRSNDPTFVLMTYLWHCLYAWDEALEALYTHICTLETQVISTSDMELTKVLHEIRAHHLHYAGLLEDFRKAIFFVRDTHNPALLYPLSQAESKEQQRELKEAYKVSRNLLEKECYNLLSEIERLEMGRRMQDRRLKNVMNLVFSSVNIQDSKRMQKMTEAALRDSAAMKQIAYLTMIFLPASFVAAVFGMNVGEIDPETVGRLGHYIATALPLTLATVYAVIAFQSEHYGLGGHSIWMRMIWPVPMIFGLFSHKVTPATKRAATKRAANGLPL